jgi:ferredoxin
MPAMSAATAISLGDAMRIAGTLAPSPGRGGSSADRREPASPRLGHYAQVMTEVSAANRILVEVDRTLCFGFGDCVDTAPSVFALDEESKAIVIDPDAASVDMIVEASQNCPVDAIIVTDESGAQIYP